MRDNPVFIAGHTGMIGSAILNKFRNADYKNIILRTHRELDLTNQSDVEEFFQKEKPEFVVLAAAKVGGIYANITYPAQFIYANLCIQINVIDASFKAGVKKLIFFASACSYPRECPQPMKEEYLLSGYLEPTNEAYAIAKIAGIKMCQAYNRQYNANFISVVLTNTYGPNDNFDDNYSHVIPALIRKFHEAKINQDPTVSIWGTGEVYREFIYVDDVADACLFLMHHYNEPEIINIGTGEDISVKELTYIVKEVVGFNGEIIFDSAKPDGAPRKLLDATKLNNLGWKAKTPLREGIQSTYKWYLRQLEKTSQV